MQSFFNSPLKLGTLLLPHRLIQGPLAGFSCAPFRSLFAQYTAPAYCISEMLSAHDVIYKHTLKDRYLYRAANEAILCYQIAGNDPVVMAEAAAKLEAFGADLIDINCGCPKSKIRKKGAGSALLAKPKELAAIIKKVRVAIKCPLTVKVRLIGNKADLELASMIADAGADALIIHGRRWQDDYDKACDWPQIAAIKQAINLPVIANGDIYDQESLVKLAVETGCDGFMISRAGTGKPWLFQELLTGVHLTIDKLTLNKLFLTHLSGLAALQNEYQAVLQSKSLVRYYFKDYLTPAWLQAFYQAASLAEIEILLSD